MLAHINFSFCFIQPVYLSLLLKKGKGKYQTQLSLEKRRSLQKTISVNGEIINVENEEVNIHDYATFEKEEELIPEFRTSIKSKTGIPLSRNNSSEAGLARKSSFKDVARQVISMESVLKKWPRRSRTRHHSSSSEDIAEDEQSKDRDDLTNDDNASVCTDTSELSDTEQQQEELSPDEIDIHASSLAGSVSVTDSPYANVNSNRVEDTDDTDKSKDKLLDKEEHDTDQNRKHEKSVKHEHAGKDSKLADGKEKSRRSFVRCPCVVL